MWWRGNWQGFVDAEEADRTSRLYVMLLTCVSLQPVYLFVPLCAVIWEWVAERVDCAIHKRRQSMNMTHWKLRVCFCRAVLVLWRCAENFFLRTEETWARRYANILPVSRDSLHTLKCQGSTVRLEWTCSWWSDPPLCCNCSTIPTACCATRVCPGTTWLMVEQL